jgi:hypothetical protein
MRRVKDCVVCIALEDNGSIFLLPKFISLIIEAIRTPFVQAY